MIEVENLTKRYGTYTAIQNISFSAQPGEILGLLGPNGAGKTTTMRILTGFMPPSGGSAKIAGFDVMQDSMEVRRRVGYMPERAPLYTEMTVKDFVGFWAKMRGMTKKTRVDEVLERFYLQDRRNNLIRSLSKGLRQRVGLAQAIVHDPQVVILDEPTIGIDPQQVIEVREFVRDLKKDHTVLFSSHILSEVENVCDRVVIINKGQVIAEGTTEMLSRRQKPGMHLFVMVEGATDNKLISLLRDIHHVDGVRKQDKGFMVTSKNDTDIRAAVTRVISDAGFTLLELRPVEVTLEDVFLELVGKGK